MSYLLEYLSMNTDNFSQWLNAQNGSSLVKDATSRLKLLKDVLDSSTLKPVVKEHGNYYHGSPTKGLKEILPISRTGAKGTSDGGRENFRDVVFLTTSLDEARRYAGKNGSVYLVDPTNVTNYRSAYASTSNIQKAKIRRKLNKLSNSIYVASFAKVLSEI